MEMPNYNFNDVSFFNSPGINVYNFHPHFIYLNACSTQLNNQLKQAFPNYSTIKKADADQYVHNGDGIRTIFKHLLSFLSKNPHCFIKDLID